LERAVTLRQLRAAYHQRICEHIIRETRPRNAAGYPNLADGASKSSVKIAWGLVRRLDCTIRRGSLSGQTIGRRFEAATRDYLQEAFQLLHHLRPGEWQYSVRKAISVFDQYEHLAYLEDAIRRDQALAPALGGDYIVKPDIVIGRAPLADEEVNLQGSLVESGGPIARLTPLRRANREGTHVIMHASVSCKWTIRSDRAQNTRTEALNLIRNRKGHLPHIVAVTAEPLPTRIATLALGTGDLDCVYHFALSELRATVQDEEIEDQLDMLEMLVEGRRLRDISDLPFDLAV
jgi:hypothetical protein